jgi:hypothetical protein
VPGSRAACPGVVARCALFNTIATVRVTHQ